MFRPSVWTGWAVVALLCGVTACTPSTGVPCVGQCLSNDTDGSVGNSGDGGTDGGPADAGATSCAIGLTLCSGQCVDTTSSLTDCQGCGMACSSGQICSTSGCTTLPVTCPSTGCPADSYCDPTTNKCVGGCLSDSSCQVSQICVANQCVAGCDSNRPCPAGDICDQSTCKPACSSDSDCPLDQMCNTTSQLCVAGCDSDDRCQSTEVCNTTTGMCQSGCRADSNCSTGQICDVTSQMCITGCREDSACSSGHICNNDQCVSGCRADSTCPLGSYCSNLMCVTGCDSDARCSGSQVCVDGECTGGCRSNSDCSIGQLCGSSQMCVPGCTVDSGCVSGDICVTGMCQVGCRTDSACSGSGMICNATTMKCQAGCRTDAACSSDEYCDTTSLTCQPGCNGDSALCGAGQTCVTYEGTASCGSDYCCSNQYCANQGSCNGSKYGCFTGGTDSFGNPDSFCRLVCTQGSTTDCPSGYVCAQFTDQPCAPDFGDTTYYCAKACTSNSDCGSTVEDTTNMTPCACDLSGDSTHGLCMYGNSTGSAPAGPPYYQCYATEAAWGL